MKLTDEQIEALNNVFKFRYNMQPITARKYDLYQEPAETYKVFTLNKLADVYYLSPTFENSSYGLPMLDGLFCFVILVQQPDKVFVGIPNSTILRSLNHVLINNTWNMYTWGIAGHCSLSHYKDVYFAGEIIFRNKELISWGNASGHYSPEQDLRKTNLLPMIKLILPENRFVSYKDRILSNDLVKEDNPSGYEQITDLYSNGYETS